MDQEIGNEDPKRTSSRVTAMELRANFLTERGFKLIARWSLNGASIKIEGTLPQQPAVYAFSVDGVVQYIGVAGLNLRTRLMAYVKPGISQATNKSNNARIRSVLEAGHSVEILGASPKDSEWNALPVNIVSGLESALIRRFKPPWNHHGTGWNYVTIHDL